MVKINMEELVFVVDTREDPKCAYQFKGAPRMRKKLDTGDYSFVGGEKYFAVERKTISDAYGTFTDGHERFKRELERSKHMIELVIVIEGPIEVFMDPAANKSRIHPNALRGMLKKWAKRYQVRFEFFESKEKAEGFTKWFLTERYKALQLGCVGLPMDGLI